MFSVQQKRDISEAVQKILRDTNHPELPKSEIQFTLYVLGAESWSWAVIHNNGAIKNPGAKSKIDVENGAHFIIKSNGQKIGVLMFAINDGEEFTANTNLWERPAPLNSERSPRSSRTSMLPTKRKNQRFVSEAYLNFIREQPCVVCGSKDSQPHHTISQGRADGSDALAIPLCQLHHLKSPRECNKAVEKITGLTIKEHCHVLWIRFGTQARQLIIGIHLTQDECEDILIIHGLGSRTGSARSKRRKLNEGLRVPDYKGTPE